MAEPLHGIDDLSAAIRDFRRAPTTSRDPGGPPVAGSRSPASPSRPCGAGCRGQRADPGILTWTPAGCEAFGTGHPAWP
ncbi:hypothetical protein QJS66_03680 [Kocuria rhizophila]|nr:hypothetical protein QJS66_03680 [Kocuria rhizophila]